MTANQTRAGVCSGLHGCSTGCCEAWQHQMSTTSCLPHRPVSCKYAPVKYVPNYHVHVLHRGTKRNTGCGRMHGLCHTAIGKPLAAPGRAVSSWRALSRFSLAAGTGHTWHGSHMLHGRSPPRVPHSETAKTQPARGGQPNLADDKCTEHRPPRQHPTRAAAVKPDVQVNDK